MERGGFYEPTERFLHCSAKVENKWTVYGGGKFQQDEGRSPSVVEELDLATASWRQRQTKGDPPPGYIGSAAASILSKFYVFGGLSAEGYFNTVHELDFNDYMWRRLDPSNTDGVCPIPKMGAGMVAFDNKLLVTFGGKGVSKDIMKVRQTPDQDWKVYALHVQDPRGADDNLVFTNELLCFNIETREWSIPPMIGPGKDQPTACAGCSLTMVDYFRAVLFGGYGVEDICVPNCVRILHMSTNQPWSWTVVRQACTTEMWPPMRACHSAVSLCDITGKTEGPPSDPRLMILFGVDNRGTSLKDVWMFSVNSKSWNKGDFPENLAVASVINSTCAMLHEPCNTKKTLFQFGGFISEGEHDHPFPRTFQFCLDFADQKLQTLSARSLTADWVNVKPEYPGLTLGVEKKKTFTNSTSDEQLMDMSDVGFSMRLYTDEDGERHVKTEVIVQPCFGGPIKMPDGYDKASPVYMMQDSNPSMKKRAVIKINHHISIDDEGDKESMVFLQGNIAPRHAERSQITYDFSVIQGGNANFEIGGDTGEITVNSLSPLCVAKRQCPTGRSNIKYGVRVYYGAPSLDGHSWDAVLSVYVHQPLYHKALASYMEKHHPTLTEEDSIVPVHFQQDESSSDDQSESKVSFLCSSEDWKVNWNKQMVIYKEQIDLVPESPDVEFGDCQDYPPKMKLRFTPGSEPPVTSECKIQVEGLRREHCFNIPLYDSRPAEKPVEDVVTSREDYLHMLITVLDCVAAKWKELGLALGFSPNDLDCIEQNHLLAVKGVKAYFHELIRQWLQWTPPDHDSPSILALHEALTSPLVEEDVVAEELLEKVEELLNENLSKLKKKYEDRVKAAIRKFGESAMQWEGNDMTKESDIVAARMTNMISNLKETGVVYADSEEIVKCCIALKQMVKDMVTELQQETRLQVYKIADGMTTKSELLKKNAHLHHKSPLGVDVEQVIKSMLDFAHSMDRLWDCMHSIVKQLPSEETLRRRPAPRKRSNTYNAGTVGNLRRYLESSIPTGVRIGTTYEPTADNSGDVARENLSEKKS